MESLSGAMVWHIWSIKSHFVYFHEFAHGTIRLTGDRVRGDDSKQYAISRCLNEKVEVSEILLQSIEFLLAPSNSLLTVPRRWF